MSEAVGILAVNASLELVLSERMELESGRKEGPYSRILLIRHVL